MSGVAGLWLRTRSRRTIVRSLAKGYPAERNLAFLEKHMHKAVTGFIEEHIVSRIVTGESRERRFGESSTVVQVQ